MDFRAVLTQWRDEKCVLYAVLFSERFGMQSVTGKVVEVLDDVVVVADEINEVRIPIACETRDTRVTMQDDEVLSVTLSWSDRRSAFLVTRS